MPVHLASIRLMFVGEFYFSSFTYVEQQNPTGNIKAVRNTKNREQIFQQRSH